jgi:HSP20 family molecular chaperone IbpA
MKLLTLIFAIVISFDLFAQTNTEPVVSADKMNIFYIGIDNPVSVAVPGVLSEKLKVTISEGTIIGSNGKYIVTVSKPGETEIAIYVETKPGVYEKEGIKKFRVQRIPNPLPDK